MGVTGLKGVTSAQILALLAEHGYDVREHRLGSGGAALRIADPESGVVVRGVLEGDVFFMTLSCLTVPASRVTPGLMRRMLASDNGISTSSFQLYERSDGSVALTLNNFCKLQSLGPEDRDDILSCVEFLMADVVAARHLIGDLAEG